MEMNDTEYFNKRPDTPGYDPRIKKYYELVEENEALQKKVKFLQMQINIKNEVISNLVNEVYDGFSMKEQGW
jgi:chaperonin cofactor prefoldin